MDLNTEECSNEESHSCEDVDVDKTDTARSFSQNEKNVKLEYGDEGDTAENDNEITPPDALQGVPVDRGWAWVILSGCVLYALIFGGVIRTFGVFFLQFQERFKANAAEIALMSLIQNIVISIVGLFIMTIGLKKLSCRTVVAIGGGLNALAHIISGFATDIRVFYFSHGLFGGAGMAMVTPPLFSVVGVYFKKHRGLANSIYTGSGSIGGLIFAPIFTTLFEEYGYTGTMIIVGGLLFNTLVTASLIRPPTWFTERHKLTGTKETKETLLPEQGKQADVEVNAGPEETLKYRQSHMHEHKLDTGSLQRVKHDINGTRNKGIYRPSSYHPDLNTSPLLARPRSWSQGNAINKVENNSEYKGSGLSSSINVLDISKSAVYLGDDLHASSLINIHSRNLSCEISTEQSENHETAQNSKACGVCFKACLQETVFEVFDMKVLKNMAFIQFLLMAFVTVSGMALVPVYLPPLAKDAGISYDNIAIMLSTMACLDFISKVIGGIIADREWIRRTTILGVAAVVTGTLCQLARFFTNLPLFIIMAVILGCFYGQYGSMYATILIDCIGLEKFQSSLGFVSLIHGISIAVFFPISGLLRDMFKSYIYSLHLCGCLAYIGAALLFLLPVVQNKLTASKTTKT